MCYTPFLVGCILALCPLSFSFDFRELGALRERNVALETLASQLQQQHATQHDVVMQLSQSEEQRYTCIELLLLMMMLMACCCFSVMRVVSITRI